MRFYYSYYPAANFSTNPHEMSVKGKLHLCIRGEGNNGKIKCLFYDINAFL